MEIVFHKHGRHCNHHAPEGRPDYISTDDFDAKPGVVKMPWIS
jgi:hypothetical protein